MKKEANAKFDKEKFLAEANKIAAQQKMNEKYGKPRQKVDPQEMVRVAAEIEAERAARRPPQWTGAQSNTRTKIKDQEQARVDFYLLVSRKN